jgi:hypothetical protein
MTPVDFRVLKERMMVAISRQLSGRLALLGLLLIACGLLCRPAWAVEYKLTKEQLQRLLKVVDQRGTRVAIPTAVASVLQLKTAQHTPDVKEAAYLDDDGNRHGFARLNDGSGFFMFSSGPSSGQVVYVVDPDLHLVHAARSLQRNGRLLALPDTEGQLELDEEFRRWSKVLSPGGPVVAPLPFPLQQGQPNTTGPAVQPQPYPFKKPDTNSAPKASETSKP